MLSLCTLFGQPNPTNGVKSNVVKPNISTLVLRGHAVIELAKDSLMGSIKHESLYISDCKYISNLKLTV
jgi:hypothetical protein